MAKVVMTANLKGGVGKSTIANVLASEVENALVLNIDETQSTESVNAGEYSVDLIDDDIDLVEALQAAKEDADLIILDTPSNFKPGQTDFERIAAVADEVDLFIIPMKLGERTIEATITSIDFLFGSGIRKKPAKILLILNDYVANKSAAATIEEIKGIMNENVIKRLETIEFMTDIDNVYLDYFPHSNAILTSENRKETIAEMSIKNKVAYRKVREKILALVEDINNILKEEK